MNGAQLLQCQDYSTMRNNFIKIIVDLPGIYGPFIYKSEPSKGGPHYVCPFCQID